MQDEYSLFLNTFLFCWNAEGLSNDIVYKISHRLHPCFLTSVVEHSILNVLLTTYL